MEQKRRNLYGRRRGPKLRPKRAALMRERLAAYALPGGGTDRIDPGAVFPESEDVWLEIGFGAGEHVIAQAEANPDVGIIACEHYLNGVAACLAQAEEKGLSNLRLHHGDARDVMDRLPDRAIGRIFLLYPDPWPKTRHHRRRFIGSENLNVFARIMRDGGILRVASDIPDYIGWTLEHLAEHPEFDTAGDAATDYTQPWPDWPGTRYEAKALREGRKPRYVTFHRRPR